jgi:hypothetical protein
VEHFAFDLIGVLGRIALDGSEARLEVFFETTRQHLSIYAYSPKPGEFTAFLTDVTHEKQMEEYKEMSREILQILSGTADFKDLIRQALASLQARAGFQSVAIRLQDRGDFPYFDHKGFPEDFLLTENSLVAHAGEGSACSGPDCNPRLDCICGLVILGCPSEAGVVTI